MPESPLGGIFFDSEPPESPSEIFGFSTDAALEAGWALERIGPVSRKLSTDGHVIQGIIELFPLIERIQEGEDITPEDVRPYRKSIKKAVHPLETADEVLKTLSIIPPFAIGRIALNKLLEREFAKKVPIAAAKARGYMPRVEPYVELISQFGNPREEFINEVGVINANVLSAIAAISSKPDAEEAAEGIKQVLFGELLQNPEDSAASLPMLSGALAIRNQRAGPIRVPDGPVISAMAPEILIILAAPLPADQQSLETIASIRISPESHPPHPLSHDQMRRFAEAAPVLLPSMRDLLPTDGGEIKERFKEVKEFLKV